MHSTLVGFFWSTVNHVQNPDDSVLEVSRGDEVVIPRCVMCGATLALYFISQL